MISKLINKYLKYKRTVARVIFRKILKRKEGERVPSWLRWLLFPWLTLLSVQDTMVYEPETDTYVIDGKRFSAVFLRTLSKDHIGECFRIVETENAFDYMGINNTITIRRISPCRLRILCNEEYDG